MANYLARVAAAGARTGTVAHPPAIAPPLLSGAPFEGSAELVDQLPPRFLARLDQVSPRGQLDGLWAETLVIHSANDELIPVEESRRLVDALRARVPTTYSELRMFEHIDVAGASGVLTIARDVR